MLFLKERKRTIVRAMPNRFSRFVLHAARRRRMRMTGSAATVR
jgi:hypothetical protein